MARVFDVIEYPNEMEDEIVHRFPEVGAGDFRIGSQVIVRESQAAVFFRDGNALDVFGPGRHTITTANIPLLIDLIGKAFNDKTPFPAEVYFVSMREFADEKWGTPQPIIIRNPNMGLGVALLQGFGTYSFQVSDVQQFVTQIVGTRGSFDTIEIESRMRSILLSKLQDLLGETAAEADKSAEELRAMGMLDMQTYTQLQAADAMRDAAQNPSGGAGLTAGIGAGMGVGRALSDSLEGVSGSSAAGAGASQPPSGGQPSGGMPDVMTPSEAATALRVSEEDVLAAIEAGDLKARKLGNAFRISKGSLEEFLNG
jgi:excisionase family DNA binding protein